MYFDQIVKIGEILVIKYQGQNIRTKLLDVLDDHYFVVLQPTLRGIPITAGEDNDFEFTFYRQNGVFLFNASMQDTFTAQGVRQSKFLAISQVEKKQRRECFRLMTAIDVVMQRINDKNIIIEKRYRGKTISISEKSIQLTSFTAFSKDTKIAVAISLEETMALQTKVLICKEPDNKNEPYEIVLLFENLSNKQKTDISRYILRQQIIARKNNDHF